MGGARQVTLQGAWSSVDCLSVTLDGVDTRESGVLVEQTCAYLGVWFPPGHHAHNKHHARSGVYFAFLDLGQMNPLIDRTTNLIKLSLAWRGHVV